MPRRRKETVFTKISPYIIPGTVIISFILAVSFTVYKVYADKQSVQQELHIAQVDIPPMDEELLARTVHWKTYVDDTYGFQIRYPDNKLKNTNAAPLFAKAGVCTKKEVQALTLEPVQFDTDSLPYEIYAQLLQVTVHVQSITENLTVDTWFDENCVGEYYQEGQYMKQRVSLYGQPAIEIAQKQNEEENDLFVTKKTSTFVLYRSIFLPVFIHSTRIVIKRQLQMLIAYLLILSQQ